MAWFEQEGGYAVSYRPPTPQELELRDKYAQTALAEESAKVRAAQPGERNHVLNASAFVLGQLVGARVLTHNQAADAMIAAASSVGIKRNEAVRTVHASIQSGERQPRDIPELQSLRPSTRPIQRQKAQPLPIVTPESGRSYPPTHEVAALWEACKRVDEDEETAAYLARRNIDATSVADSNLARALPHDYECPKWAKSKDGEWRKSGHRLIVPMYDSRGTMRSVLARALVPGVEVKSRPPSGFRRSSLIMACPFGQLLLRRGERPSWWPADVDFTVIIAEGETDWLTWSTQWSDADEHAPVTLGIVSGSWTIEIAERLPDEIRVVIATDADKAGERYCETILQTIARRKLNIERWKPTVPTQEAAQ